MPAGGEASAKGATIAVATTMATATGPTGSTPWSRRAAMKPPSA